MDLHFRLARHGDLSAQIYRQLLDAVIEGRLEAGQRLPATRPFATQLGVARNTVALAYERLVAEGVLVGRTGAGTFVGSDGPRPRSTRRAPSGDVQPRAVWRSTIVPSARPARLADYDFSVGVPDLALFPFAEWGRLLAQELRAATAAYGAYRDPAGYAGLREAIARHSGISRSVRADAEDVIVTQGAQQAFDLIGRILISDGTPVAVEEPGYPYARLLFQSQGARVVGVRVDAEGIDVAALPDHARLVYATPSHQFPLGTVMSLRRRTALLEWAERRGAVVIEDDYDSEFRFGGRPLDPLQSLDRTGRVIYVGSFSKVLLPALRCGFLVAPASLLPALRAAKQLSDWHGDLVTQGALARFIERGRLARHIRGLAREYATRFAQLTQSLERHLGARLRLLPSAAGLHLAATVVDRTPADVEQLVRRAEARDVRVSSMAGFYTDEPAEAGLVIGFGAIPSARIDEGIRRLAASFDEPAGR